MKENNHPLHSEKPNNHSLVFPRVLYFSIWIIVGLLALLFETDVLPGGVVKADVQIEYALHMLCVVLTLAAIPGALKLFSIQKGKGTTPLSQMCLLRIGLMALPIFVNLIVYYALLSSTIPLYCLLISLLAFVFCLPGNSDK